MKAMILVVAIVFGFGGCAGIPGTGGITTTSVIYTTEFDRIPLQATIDRCQEIGQAVFDRYGVAGGGGEGWVRGGVAYEKCMLAAGYTAK